MTKLIRFVPASTFLFLTLVVSQPALSVEPGVDIATPRVAVSNVSNALSFSPARLAVEQGDYVRWNVLAGTTLLHTTTSGSACAANGLWGASLSSATPQFTRQFLEPPQILPFFCSPHCGLGMVGEVNVTTLIDVAATDTAGTLKLTWTGGSGSYSIFRSATPAFPVATTTVLPPDGGAGTTFTDVTAPQKDSALFYLVMNRF